MNYFTVLVLAFSKKDAHIQVLLLRNQYQANSHMKKKFIVTVTDKEPEETCF